MISFPYSYLIYDCLSLQFQLLVLQYCVVYHDCKLFKKEFMMYKLCLCMQADPEVGVCLFRTLKLLPTISELCFSFTTCCYF